MKWLEDVTRDAQFAFRMLARRPSFAAAVIVTLGLGVGLSAAMFSVFDAVLLRPLPVHDQERIVVLWAEAEGSIRRLPLDYRHFEGFRENPQTLEEVAGVLNPRSWPHAVREGERVSMLNIAPVTGNFFHVLGSRPVLGRLLGSDDDDAGAARVTVISHALWQRHFGGDPGVLGRTLTLHERGHPYTIVGVAPPGLEYPAAVDFWVPISLFSELEAVPVGRLAAGATPAHAAAELRASFERDASPVWRHVRTAATPLRDVVLGHVKPAVRLLSACSALLLLIACFNVSNLLLARSSGRLRELDIRRALGAPRTRILRQLLTESCVLGLAGGALGAALAGALVEGLVALAPAELPRLEEIRVASTPLAWAAAVSMATALTFGLVPAFVASRPDSSPLHGSRSTTDSRLMRRLQDSFVILQVGLAIVVLSASGLLVRSLLQLQRVHMGFSSESLAIVEFAWPDARLDTPEKVSAFYELLVPRLQALPEVVSVSPMHLMPFEGASGGIDGPFIAEGSGVHAAAAPTLSIEVVGPDYFRTLGIPLLRGREFTSADRNGSVRVMVVTDTVAQHFWPDGGALGKRLGMGEGRSPEDWWTVVGIVPETRYRQMREPTPTVFVPASQFMTVKKLAVRTTGDPAQVIPSIRQIVQEIESSTLVSSVQTVNSLVAQELAQPRLNAVLLGVFGAGAVILAGVGLYAVLAYVVRQRRRELAIRGALGASPSRLRSIVVRHAVGLACAGVALGLTAALSGARLIEAMLFEVRPSDPATLAGVASFVLAVALGAAYLPARRAMRADPAAVLRHE